MRTLEVAILALRRSCGVRVYEGMRQGNASDLEKLFTREMVARQPQLATPRSFQAQPIVY